jgi:hypothetical protein
MNGLTEIVMELHVKPCVGDMYVTLNTNVTIWVKIKAALAAFIMLRSSFGLSAGEVHLVDVVLAIHFLE